MSNTLPEWCSVELMKISWIVIVKSRVENICKSSFCFLQKNLNKKNGAIRFPGIPDNPERKVSESTREVLFLVTLVLSSISIKNIMIKNQN